MSIFMSGRKKARVGKKWQKDKTVQKNWNYSRSDRMELKKAFKSKDSFWNIATRFWTIIRIIEDEAVVMLYSYYRALKNSQVG